MCETHQGKPKCLLDKAQPNAFEKTVPVEHSSSLPPLWSKAPLGGGSPTCCSFERSVGKTTNSQKVTDIVGGSGCRPLTNNLKFTLLSADVIGTDNKIGNF